MADTYFYFHLFSACCQNITFQDKFSTINFTLVSGTSNKWCADKVYINGNNYNNYEATKNFSYCIEQYDSGQWVISIDHPDDNYGSGFTPVYTSTMNVNCPTEIKYDEWTNTFHYWWHRVQQNMLKCNESQGT